MALGAKEVYDKMRPDREQFLQRARHNALLTIPSLMPLEGHDGKAHLYEPYQSLGAKGVVSLASRLTMALIPAGRPHMRFDIPPLMALQMEGEIPPEVTQDLAKSEKLVQSAVERANWRKTTLDSTLQLIVAGNAIEHMLPDQTIRVFRLDQFVLRRDYTGVVVEAVIKELLDPAYLPDGLTAPVEAAAKTTLADAKERDIELYTWIKLVTEKGKQVYKVTQETEGGTPLGKANTYSIEDLPYLFLRWSSTPGEDYGRSKVEEVAADLRSLDALRKSALEMAAMGARNFTMIRPGANANGLRNRITRIANGDVVVGDPETVELKQFASTQGYQITQDQVDKLVESIATAFLLLGAQQRNAERVTATEIERDIQELEATLGGVFSTLSLEMLEKRTRLLIEDMKSRNEFPKVGKEDLQITVLTGLEALSRERDVSRGMQAAQIAAQFGEQGLAAIKMDVVLNKIFVGLGFPDAIKSAEEIAEEQQRMQQQALVDKLGPAAIQAATKMQQGEGNG